MASPPVCGFNDTHRDRVFSTILPQPEREASKLFVNERGRPPGDAPSLQHAGWLLLAESDESKCGSIAKGCFDDDSKFLADRSIGELDLYQPVAGLVGVRGSASVG